MASSCPKVTEDSCAGILSWGHRIGPFHQDPLSPAAELLLGPAAKGCGGSGTTVPPIKGPLDQSCEQLQQQPVSAMMERVAVDIMGPFPTQSRGMVMSSQLWTILRSGQRPRPSQTKRLRPWQTPKWRGCLIGLAQLEPYTATRAGILNQRCSLPCACALGCRKLAQPHLTPRVMARWSGLI